MFTRFTSMIHHAVEALAPNVPLQQEFLSHWKSITQYFVEVKDHKVSVDQTPVPGHLKQMLRMLVKEEKGGEVGVAGPCMEYLLKERILETLYTLARTDCPPGMKQVILQLFVKLLSHIKQPLLPHIHVHRPVQRLVKMCGEVKASPAESDEIQFLLTLCSTVTQDPYLVNFFIELPKSNSTSVPSKSNLSSEDTIEIRRRQTRFTIVDSLLNLMHSEDARVSVKACEGLMLVASLPDGNAAHHLLCNTRFTKELTSQLCNLYTALPKGIYPADVESVEAKWGLDLTSSIDDRHSFPGKRHVISFLSWLDFCDQLMSVAHQDVAKELASCVRKQFLDTILEPAMMHTSEAEAIMATAHLNRCLRLVSSPELLSEFVLFILGEEEEVETEDTPSNHRLRRRLLERCDHISEEVCIITWKLFETLLSKPNEHIVNNLVLRNLLSRGYATSISLPGSVVSSPAYEKATICHKSLPTSPTVTSDISLNLGLTSQSQSFEVANINHSSSRQVNSLSLEEDFSIRVPTAMTSSSLCSLIEPSGPSSAEPITSQPGGFHLCPVDFLEKVSQPEVGKEDGSFSVDLEKTDVRPSATSHVEESSESATDDEGCSESSTGFGESPDAILQNHDTNLLSSYATVESGDRCSLSEVAGVCELDDIRNTVNTFLNVLPKDAISSHHSADSGYDSYLRDAKHQFSLCLPWHKKFQWPSQPVCRSDGHDQPFFEGLFLRKLLEKVASMLHQSYEVNLQVTCVAARLALLPHPNIHEFLLNPHLPLRQGCRTLSTVLQKVAHDVESRIQVVPDFQRQLLNVRHRLMGYSNGSIRHSDDLSLMAGVIVLEEFCKELAAIAFVKHHADVIHR